MIALFQRLLAPYLVSPFNSLSDTLDGDFTLVLTRSDSTPDRQWTVPWPELRGRVGALPSQRLDIGRRGLEVSQDVRTTLDDLKPQEAALGGWTVHACWGALRWARRRGVRLIDWVKGSLQTGPRQRPLIRAKYRTVPPVLRTVFRPETVVGAIAEAVRTVSSRGGRVA